MALAKLFSPFPGAFPRRQRAMLVVCETLWHAVRLVKTPEPPIENLRGLVTKLPDVQEEKQPAGDFVPRYVEIPSRRSHRNRILGLGLGSGIIALLLIGIAMLLSGPRALLPPAVAVATFTALWILARLRLFRQRNGLFLAIGLVALLGAGISLVQHAFLAWTSPAARPADHTAHTASESDADLPLLSKELGLSATEVGTRRHGRMLRDWPVMIGRRRYLMKSGEIFPVEEVRESEVTFRVNEVRGVVPAEVMEIAGSDAPPGPPSAPLRDEIPVSPEDARLTQRAQQEAVRRYPALGVKGSPENQLFLQTYEDWKSSGSELLQDPEWPLLLASLLAKREGWERSETVVE